MDPNKAIMSEVKIVAEGDPPPYPDLADKTLHHVGFDRMVVLQGGTTGGRASVMIFAELPDGSFAYLETTARVFEMLAAAVRGACQRWGEDNT